METKICIECKKELPIINFEWQKNRPNPRKICKLCKSRKDAKNLSYERKEKIKEYKKAYYKSGRGKDIWEKCKYGVCKSELDYDYCLICGSKNMIHIDHCHKTNKFRGLLCSKCNTGLGMFDENINKMENAIKYIKIWQHFLSTLN